MWPRPNETEPVQKIAYFTKVGDQVCAVGYYPFTSPKPAQIETMINNDPVIENAAGVFATPLCQYQPMRMIWF